MSPDLEHLLESSGWVRGLARSLVGDAQAADDLAQDALVVALERAPAEARGPGLRRWLAAVVRNLARDRRRGEGRRDARERAVARPETDERDGEAAARLERLDTHRAVVDAVRALDEPYRTAILLRYFEGHRPPEIAERLGVPVRTVHSRLNRALAKLRERLAGELGPAGDAPHEPGGWLLALLPLAERAGGASHVAPTATATSASPASAATGVAGGALTGALIMDVKLKLALAGAALAGVAAVATLARTGPEAAEPLAAATPEVREEALTSPERPAPLAPAAPRSREVAAKTSVPAPAEEAPEEVPAASPAPALHGRVLDVAGLPVAGVEVALVSHGATADDASSAPRATSGADGSFELHAHGRTGEIDVADGRYTSVLRPTLFAPRSDDYVLIVAERQTVAGVVVDTDGVPLADATLTVDLDDNFRASLGLATDHSRAVRWTVTTGDDGRFELDAAPRTEHALLVTSRAGFARDVRRMPLAPTYDLEVVLGEPARDVAIVEGHVVDEDGRPVEGAHVALDQTNGRTDADGRFALQVRAPGERGVLIAVKAGHMPASIERQGASSMDAAAWPDPLVLRLEGEPYSIRGRVLDEDGDPIAGAEVWTEDKTHFGAIEHEDFGPRMTVVTNVEALLKGKKTFGAPKETTDADGRFELTGLLAKDYRVSVQDKGTLAFTQTEPIAAGTSGLTIRMDAVERHPRVAGRVVGLDGEPVAGVRVALCRAIGEPPEDGGRPVDALETHPVTTDAEGRFELTDVVAPITHANVQGEGLDLANTPIIAEGADLERLELVVARSCHVRVELADAEEAAHARFYDADDRPCMVTVHRGNYAWSSGSVQLADGRTETITVSERACTIALTKDGAEVRRVPIRLRADETNVLRP